MLKIVVVAGARPNFMKIAPILKRVEARGHQAILVHTGQHYDPAMSDVFFAELGIRKPDYHLGVQSGTHAVQTANIMIQFEAVLDSTRPDWVVVVGDVNSTLASSLVAAKRGVRVAHVEAGLRSRDWEMPEEINRVVTDSISDLLLTPSDDASDNLRQEGSASWRIINVGNVMIDTLMMNIDRARQSDVLERLDIQPKSYALLTLHRPSNVDDPFVLARIMTAVREIAETETVVWPKHPRIDMSILEEVPNLRIIGPVGYLDSIKLQMDSGIVLTDSGGIQEETTALGVPCLTLRENTERPVTITEGTNTLVGDGPTRIVEAYRDGRTATRTPRRPKLWDGKAAERIVDAIEAYDSLNRKNSGKR